MRLRGCNRAPIPTSAYLFVNSPVNVHVRESRDALTSVKNKLCSSGPDLKSSRWDARVHEHIFLVRVECFLASCVTSNCQAARANIDRAAALSRFPWSFPRKPLLPPARLARLALRGQLNEETLRLNRGGITPSASRLTGRTA